MSKPTCPQTCKQVLDDSFLEARARLLDVAALLDRVDRCADADNGKQDFRYQALKKGLEILTTATQARARQLLDAWSDPTSEPRQSAAGLKGAFGAWDEGAS